MVAQEAGSDRSLGPDRVVRMRREPRDRHVHPVSERQSIEQAVELRLAAGAVQAYGLGLAASGGQLPKPDEMPFLREPGCGGRLGVLAMLNLVLRGPSRNFDFELN